MDEKMSENGPFLIYSTGGGLIYYANEAALNEALGHDYSNGLDWESSDRVIDSSGHMYKIVYDKEDRFYHTNDAGEIWDYRKVLSLATDACRTVKRDPRELHHKVETADDADKIRIIMEHVRGLPEGPPMFIAFQWFFFIVFAAIIVLIVYGLYRLVDWLM
jgi:hypothetical protein